MTCQKFQTLLILWSDHYIKVLLKYRKRNLWRAFVDFLFDSGAKVASSSKRTHIKVREEKQYPI